MATRRTKPVDQAETEEQTVEKVDKIETIKPSEIDLHQYIPVKNGFHGMLDYLSKRTGEFVHWDEFGDEKYIELIDLQHAKGNARKFFENNWFIFDDEYQWVIDFIGVRNFYDDSLSQEEFDELITTCSADEVEARVSKLSDGQKKTYALYAREKVEDGTIDSRKVIAVLEKVFKVDLSTK
jgi:hypothetical protein